MLCFPVIVRVAARIIPKPLQLRAQLLVLVDQFANVCACLVQSSVDDIFSLVRLWSKLSQPTLNANQILKQLLVALLSMRDPALLGPDVEIQLVISPVGSGRRGVCIFSTQLLREKVDLLLIFV